MQISTTPPAQPDTLKKLLRCRVKVNGTVYTGLFASTFDAVNHAQARYGHNARISAQRVAGRVEA